MLYGWPWGKELVNVPVPKGNWKIVAFVSESYRQTVPIPTRGAGGYAIDHCRQDVTDFFSEKRSRASFGAAWKKQDPLFLL